jgi:peptidylglycine monooxygenase
MLDCKPQCNIHGEAGGLPQRRFSLGGEGIKTVYVGTGDYCYEVVPDWPKLPAGVKLGTVSAVTIDSAGRVCVFARGAHPLAFFDEEGNFLASWGHDLIADAHGLSIDAWGQLYLVDRDGHQVLKCDGDGHVLMRLGVVGQASRQAPFNHPTDVAVGPSGNIYVSDGYGNSCIHKFDESGRHLLSWGEPGLGPGCFRVPHAVWVSPEDEVYVCDRDNHRVQIFTADGEYLREWTDFFRPTGLFMDVRGAVYVTDLSSRLSIYSPDGELRARARLLADGGHDIWGDQQGNLYVAEVFAGRLDKYVRL